MNVGGAQHAAELGAPLVVLLERLRLRRREARRRTSSRTRPARSAPTAGRSCTARRRRASRRGSSAPRGSSAGRRQNFVRTMLRLGAERDEVAVVDDQRGCPTYVGHLAAATHAVLELPFGVYHVAAAGDCTLGGVRRGDLRGGRASTAASAASRRAEFGARAPRPAYSVLRSRAGRARAAALARRPARMPRTPR